MSKSKPTPLIRFKYNSEQQIQAKGLFYETRDEQLKDYDPIQAFYLYLQTKVTVSVP